MAQGDSKLDVLKKVAVYRRGDKVVIGEYHPQDTEESKEQVIENEELEEYKRQIKAYYESILENIKQQAYTEAYERGYKDGYTKAYSEASEKLLSITETFTDEITSLESDIRALIQILKTTEEQISSEIENAKQAAMIQMLEELPDLVSDITHAIADKALKADEEFLEGYIKKAIAKLKASEVIELRVPQDLEEKVSAIADRLMEKDINIRKIVVNVDPHLVDGLVADSKLGLVDARLESVIGNFKDVIREVVGYYAQRSSRGSEKTD